MKQSIVYDFIISLSRINHNENLEKFVSNYDKEITNRIKLNDEIIKWVEKTRNQIPEKYRKIIDIFFNKDTVLRIVFLYYIRKNKINQVSDFIEFVKTLDGKQFILKYFSLFTFAIEKCEYRDEKEAEKILKHELELMDFVDSLPFDSNRKWELLQVSRKPTHYLNLLAEFLQWYNEKLFKSIKKKIIKIIKSKEVELRKKIDYYGEDYLSLLINTDSLDLKERQVILVVSYFLEISYLFVLRDDRREDIFLVGYRHNEIFIDRQHGVLANVHIFKALCDETRQNIIKFLNNKKSYGDEIARELNLSNSTVSYHLNILMFEGFVKVKRIEKKNYFVLNKKILENKVMRALNRMIYKNNKGDKNGKKNNN